VSRSRFLLSFSSFFSFCFLLGLRWYRLSAEAGYAAAQAYMGFAYYSGSGVLQNLQEAVRYYGLAAEQGYAAAQCNLGLCYEHGYGTTQNPEMAVRWYKAGSEQGKTTSFALLFLSGFLLFCL
jgi:TPR repeat protein